MKQSENIKKLRNYMKKKSLIQVKQINVKNANQSDFMNQCVPKLIKEGYEQKQAVAICYEKWRSGKTKLDEK